MWILEDYDTNKWRLKHVVNPEELFGQINIQVGSELYDADYRVLTVHLEWNLIFFVGEERTIITYDMDQKKFMLSLPVSIAMVDVASCQES